MSEVDSQPRPLSEDRRTYRDERNGADRCWIWRDGYHYPQVSFSRPDPKVRPSVEYMRVLSRDEIDRLWQSQEGVDAMQLVNSLMRTVEGQRKHIRRLQEQLQAAEHELGMAAEAEQDSYAINDMNIPKAGRDL